MMNDVMNLNLKFGTLSTPALGPAPLHKLLHAARNTSLPGTCLLLMTGSPDD
jgi:hypothetical protein